VQGRTVTIYIINPVNIGTPSDGTVTTSKLSGNITMPGTLTVGAFDVAFDSPTFFVDNSNSRVGLGTATPSVPVDIVGEVKISSHLTLGTTSKVQFGDSGTYIHQSADGVLDLVSDTEIEINATTIDVNGALDVSGAITGTLATAAQTNITSVGTLSALTVTGDANFDSGTLFVDSSANAVGIGTDNPSDKVQILDSGNLALRVESSGASNQSAVWTENNAGSINGMFVYGSSHSTYGAIGAGEGAFYSNTNINIMSDSASGVIKFSTGSSGGSERLRINSTGIDVTGTITGDDGLSIQGGTGNAYLQVGSDTGSWTWKNYRSSHKLALEDSDGTGEVLSFSTAGEALFGSNVGLIDNKLLMFGTGQDGRMFFDPSTNGFTITATNGTANNLHLKSNEILLSQANAINHLRMVANTGIIINEGSADLDFRVESNDASHMFFVDGGTNRVGINTASPVGDGLTINVGGNGSEGNPVLFLGGDVGYSLNFWLDGTAAYMGQNSANRALRLYSGAETAGVNLANGGTSFGTFSDERLKENIQDIGSVIEKIKDIRCVTFNRTDVEDAQETIGFIAQDFIGKFDQVLDESKVLDTDEETRYSIKYTETIPVLLKAIQEQQTLIESLTARITTLEG
jgi:hypothetical protein